MVGILAWAGFEVVYPEGLSGLCCGMSFASKAFFDAASLSGARTVDALFAASRDGRDPVVTDASPCAGTLLEAATTRVRQGRALALFDLPTFWAREVVNGGAELPRRPGMAVLHPTCTLIKMGGVSDLRKVAQAHSESVFLPAFAECCGFAGDRGFLVPEVTQSATRGEAAEVRSVAPDGGNYSTCRTCEIGMSRAVGRPYRSIAHLIHEAIFGA
jgi:D-lactate dehydrogenase